MLYYIQMQPLSVLLDANISPTPGCDNKKCYQFAKYLFGGIRLPFDKYYSEGKKGMMEWDRDRSKLSHSTK